MVVRWPYTLADPIMALPGLPTYHAQRRVIQTISTLLIVVLPFLNILRLDIPTLRFYFLTSVLWVDEFYLLFLVIMLVLWIIVIFSMVYGRVWCGWMCPQTVLDEVYYWAEARTRRWLRVPGPAQRTGTGLARYVAHLGILGVAMFGLSLFVGFNLVAYFVDPYRLLGEIVTGTVGTVTWGIIVGIAILVWVDVMFWREKFCTKTCPYGMLQAVFTDSKTQIVRYATERHDECIECKACVRDCPMGIDIRQSPYQTECTHCGECVDSCTAILGRLKSPLPTLIAFSWGERDVPRTRWYQKFGFVDAKRWAVLALTVAYAGVLVYVVHARTPLSLTASGDRSTLYHVTDDGRVYNEYALKISNRSLSDDAFVVTCSRPEVDPSHGCAVALDRNPLPLASREVCTTKMRLYVPQHRLKPGPNRLVLTATSVQHPEVHAATDIVFFMPENDLSGSGSSTRALQ